LSVVRCQLSVVPTSPTSPTSPTLSYVCDYHLNIADQILAQPEGIVPNDTSDRELFSLLSDFYLNPVKVKATNAEEELDLMIV